MKIQRTKNAVRNIGFGVFYKLVVILFPFVVRTVMLYVMGTEYVGLNSLFTSILSFLSLAELGIGHALVYTMYRPIAENDTDSVCALLNLYRKIYRYIGFIILGVGSILIPFLKYLVKMDADVDVNIYVLYGIYLLNTVISYWMFGYKQSLLQAYQRTDIISKRSLVVQSAMYIFQILVLFMFKNYYIYIILMPIFTILTNIANSIIVDRLFPNYTCRGTVSKEISDSIRKRVLALFGTKANSVLMHAADNIVISAFLGIVMVGQYGNYYYIMNSIIGFITIIYDSITAGIGNSIVVDEKEKIYNDFKTVTFLNNWIVTFCSICLLCLYQPFMEIWVGKDLMFGMDIVILLVIYFFVYQERRIILTYKDAAGIWWEDRFRPYAMMVINLVCNIILVQFIGLYGVILSTIFSMIIGCPWETFTVFHYVFNRSMKSYFVEMGIYCIVDIVICIICFLFCELVGVGGILGLILRLLICTVVQNMSFVLIFYRTTEFAAAMKKAKGFFRKKVKKKKVQ